MGKSKEVKKYVDISGFNISQANRGNAALSYGTISFLEEKQMLVPKQELVFFQYYRNPFKAKYLLKQKQRFEINGKVYSLHIIPVWFIEQYLCLNFKVLRSLFRYGRFLKEVAYEAADYGGDGFSDIYGEKLFYARLNQTIPFMRMGIPLYILPQTIGPFKSKEIENVAHKVLCYAKEVYVRDDRYADTLEAVGIRYKKTKDLSAYMKPEPWDIHVEENAIGLNISGLAYSNKFYGLENQFDQYPALVEQIIELFRSKGCTVYLIPHSYDYAEPQKNNDDMVACRSTYEKLQNKENVVFVDKNLSAPQVKFLISKMNFFIGTRMHANFAAIYTNTPVFGLAYSYKFVGAFNANGLDGAEQTASVNNITKKDIESILSKIEKCYNKYVSNKK